MEQEIQVNPTYFNYLHIEKLKIMEIHIENEKHFYLKIYSVQFMKSMFKRNPSLHNKQ